jgi:hypothetical protein
MKSSYAACGSRQLTTKPSEPAPGDGCIGAPAGKCSLMGHGQTQAKPAALPLMPSDPLDPLWVALGPAPPPGHVCSQISSYAFARQWLARPDHPTRAHVLLELAAASPAIRPLGELPIRGLHGSLEKELHIRRRWSPPPRQWDPRLSTRDGFVGRLSVVGRPDLHKQGTPRAWRRAAGCRKPRTAADSSSHRSSHGRSGLPGGRAG